MFVYRIQNGCYRVREVTEFKDVLLKAEARKMKMQRESLRWLDGLVRCSLEGC